MRTYKPEWQVKVTLTNGTNDWIYVGADSKDDALEEADRYWEAHMIANITCRQTGHKRPAK